MIKCENISLSFGENEVIKNLSFDIKKGETVCISGPSGKGKTTVLRIICGLEKNFSGKLEISDGLKIGFVFQDDVLLPWYSALENVSAVSTKESATKWLTVFGLGDSLEKKPNQLSGGMKRRVSLARACAFSPDILVLDEAFKGLDYKLKIKIIQIIKNEFKNLTVIFTTHDAEETKLFGARIIEI